jgi:tetratricopeptide (TPR) repeat protein
MNGQRVRPRGPLWHSPAGSWLAIAASLATTAVLGLCTYGSVRLAYADLLGRRNSQPDLVKAIRLTPDDASLRLRLARISWRAVESDRRVAALEEALRLNPRSSPALMDLGLLAEANQDYALAENLLHRAAGLDRRYEPRWTLANYYFRRNTEAPFWHWTREAAATAYGDLRPLFVLCWRFSQDPEVIFRRAIPEKPSVFRQYLTFLLQQRRLGAKLGIIPRVLESAGASEVPLLLDACDYLLASGNTDGALEVWNKLVDRNLLSASRVAPERGLFLANGHFTYPLLGRGFGWRVPKTGGISITRLESAPSLRISFTGRQPENCVVLEVLAPVLPAGGYCLSYQHRTDAAPSTGLYWRVSNAPDGRTIAQESAEAAGAGWSTGTLRFRSPVNAGLLRFQLGYRRERGTTRIESVIELRRVELRCDR